MRALVTIVVVSTAAGAYAQAPGGPEIQVNQVTAGEQILPAVAVEADGGYVVVWRSAWYTIAGRRFDSSGAPRGPEFTVNILPLGQSTRPSVAAHPAGGFVVVWHTPDASGLGVVARHFDAAGNPTTGEMPVNLTVAGDHVSPRITSGPFGYAVVFVRDYSFNILFRLLSPSGTPLGAEFQVGQGILPAVAWRGGNNLAFAWREHGQPDRVRLGLFNTAGGLVVPTSVVNGPNPPMPDCPSCYADYRRGGIGVAAAANGSVAVTWDLYGYRFVPPNGQVTEQFGSYIRRYDPTGTPLGPEVRLNAYTGGSQEQPWASMAPGGGTFVAWSSIPYMEPSVPQDGSGASVYGRFFDAGGADLAGGEFRVNATTTGDQSVPVVAAADTSVFAVYQMTDGAGMGLFARRIDWPMTSALLEVDPTDEPASDGNRVFENGETVVVAPAWRNPNGIDQPLTSTAMGFGGLAGPTYSIVDASADFGVIPHRATRSCRDTGDCFLFGVTGARPATHWDTWFTEFPPAPFLFAPRPRALHIGDSFGDVPRSSPFYRFVETVFHHTVMTRCATASFCPSLPVTRDAMAFHVLRAAAPALVPAYCVQFFPDVPDTNIYCPYVEELARRGVVGGCGGGLYCPAQGVSREAMAVFLLLTREGTGYVPPACTVPPFTDVPVSSPFCPWIAELARRGIVGGCGGGAYCPAATVSREQMAVFLTGTFGLLLYAP